jgi:hypothetical protein
MRFAKFTLASTFMLFTGSMLVPGAASVNQHVVMQGKPVVQLADGMPLPPPPRGDGSHLADGMPLPPPPRIDGSGETLA